MVEKVKNIVAFLDTCIFLHYKRIDQIDWLKMLNADNVDLCVAQITLRELSEKEAIGSPKNKERAKRTLKYFESLPLANSNPEIRNKVKIKFLDFDPPDEYFTHAYNLSSKVNDDWLLASILEYNKHIAGNAVLISRDIPIRLKAKKLGINVFTPKDDYLLPPEKDSTILELKKLKDRIPKLKVAFQNDKEEISLKLKFVECPDQCIKCELERTIYELANYSSQDCANKSGYNSRFMLLINNVGVAPVTNMFLFLYIPRKPDFWIVRYDAGWKSSKIENPDSEDKHVKAVAGKEHYCLSFKCDSLNPNMKFQTPNIWFYFANLDKLKPKQIKYEIMAAELPKPIKGDLTFISDV